MRTFLILALSVFLHSCYSKDSKIEALQQRITILEQRIDSLTHTNSSYSLSDANAISFAVNINQCKGITKKGKACKRKAKYRGYCWQHKDTL